MEVLEIIKKEFPQLGWKFAPWRAGDQRVYVSDVSKAERDFGWQPKTGSAEGISKLITWAQENASTLPPI